jgi:carbonic anhydrase
LIVPKERFAVDLIYRFDPFKPIVLDRPESAEAAIRVLLEGNKRLVAFIDELRQATIHGGAERKQTIVPVDLLSIGLPILTSAAPDQAPFALVLGCSDARVPIESVFDQNFNDLFVVRIAGNVLGTECLGSFDYAVRHLGPGLKAVVVLGHTCCGAITAAVDTYLNPDDYADIAFTHALRSLVERMLVGVRGAARAIERRCGHDVVRHPGFRAALVEASVYLNSAITAFDLKREIASAGGDHSSAVFYGACDISTMLVRYEASSDDRQPGLRSAPSSADDFVTIADQLARAVSEGELLQ